MKKLVLITMLLLLAGCGMVNNFGLIGKNIKRMVTSHPYSVEEGEEEQVLASGMGIVVLDFGAAATAWMRIDEDGNFEDKNYTLTYNEAGARGIRASQLPPGTYFMNGVIVNNEGMTGYYARSIKMDKFGWDEEKNQARCMSFTVKAGEKLKLPHMELEIYSTDTICPYIATTAEEDTFFIGDESRKNIP